MELPSHPEADDPGTEHRPATAGRWAAWLAVVVVVALVALMLILHLTGAVGPGAH